MACLFESLIKQEVFKSKSCGVFVYLLKQEFNLKKS